MNGSNISLARIAYFLLSCIALVACSTGLAAAEHDDVGHDGHTADSAQNLDVSMIKHLFDLPESGIELALAKLTIDHMVDPSVEIDTTLRELDRLASGIRVRIPKGTPSRARLELLLYSLYMPGDWNDGKPFSYDLDDPLGTTIRNKLLSTYLRTRKGNCVSMPILFVLLGQKLDLDVTLATAPLHVLVKFRQDDGSWLNVETTSGGFKLDSSYQNEMGISERALANQIYLRPLSKRESIGVMASTLMEHYANIGDQSTRLHVADLALQVNPRDTVAMLQMGSAYYGLLKSRFLDRYRSPAEIPPALQPEFAMLGQNNMMWFQKAEALGWVEPQPVDDADYLDKVRKAKAAKGLSR